MLCSGEIAFNRSRRPMFHCTRNTIMLVSVKRSALRRTPLLLASASIYLLSSAFERTAIAECGRVASMTGVFTGSGKWRQVAETLDSPLGFAMFINHGIRISEGVPGRIGGVRPERRGCGSGRGEWGGFPRRQGPVAATRVGFSIPPLVPRCP